MTIRLTFDLDAVCMLAEHAAAAPRHQHHPNIGDGPAALLLCSGSNGIWLTGNALPTQPAPAGQPGTLQRRAVFAQQCPPGTPPPVQAQLLRGTTMPLSQVLPLHAPTGHPLLAQLRAGFLAGATTVTVTLSPTAVDVAVGHRRVRSTVVRPGSVPAPGGSAVLDERRRGAVAPPATAPFRVVLDLASTHLPKHLDRDGLHEVDGVTAYPLLNGWLMWVPTDPHAHAEKYPGLPAVVLTIQRYARDRGCDYVLFDADGHHVEDLPVWDW